MSGRRKRYAVLAAAAALTAVAASLASAAPMKNASPSATSATNGVLDIMGFGPGDEIANTRAEIAEKAVGARVNNPRGGFSDQTFLAAVASRDVPDLVYIDRAKVGTYAARNAFIPLNACIAKEKIELKQFRAATLAEVRFGPRIYAIPEFTNQRTIIVNDRVAASAGLQPRDLSVTNWAKLRQVNRQLLRKDGNKVTRIGFDPKLPEFFPLWAKANGVSILSKDGKKALLNSPRAIAALTFAYSLIQDHGGWGPFKSFRDTWDFFGAKNQVAENQIGAWPMEAFYYSTLAQNSPGVQITGLPFTNRKGGPITLLTGNGWAIPRGAKDPGLSCKWIKSMTRWETWLAAAKVRFNAQKARNRPFTGVYTANSVADVKIYEDVYQKMGRADFDEAVKLLVQVQRYGFTIPPTKAGAEFQQAWMDAVTRVLNGQQSPRAALNQAQREAQRAIDRAN